MIRYCVMDTETTGLLKFNLPADHPDQPRLAHLAMILLDEDLQSVSKIINHYVKPDGWVMPPEAQKINNLSTEFLDEHGLPISEVLDSYAQVVGDGFVIAAYNAQFDLKMLRSELRRAKRADMFEQTPNICLMRAAVEVVRIERMLPGGGFKLKEAADFFGIQYEKLHDAHTDATIAAEILKALAARKALPEAMIHYAKDHPTEKKEETL